MNHLETSTVSSPAFVHISSQFWVFCFAMMINSVLISSKQLVLLTEYIERSFIEYQTCFSVFHSSLPNTAGTELVIEAPKTKDEPVMDAPEDKDELVMDVLKTKDEPVMDAPEDKDELVMDVLKTKDELVMDVLKTKDELVIEAPKSEHLPPPPESERLTELEESKPLPLGSEHLPLPLESKPLPLPLGSKRLPPPLEPEHLTGLEESKPLPLESAPVIVDIEYPRLKPLDDIKHFVNQISLKINEKCGDETKKMCQKLIDMGKNLELTDEIKTIFKEMLDKDDKCQIQLENKTEFYTPSDSNSSTQIYSSIRKDKDPYIVKVMIGSKVSCIELVQHIFEILLLKHLGQNLANEHGIIKFIGSGIYESKAKDDWIYIQMQKGNSTVEDMWNFCCNSIESQKDLR